MGCDGCDGCKINIQYVMCVKLGAAKIYICIYLRSRDIVAASFPHTSRTRSAKGFRGKYDISSLCISVHISSTTQ